MSESIVFRPIADRPKPIGLGIVRLLRREGDVLHLHNVESLDDRALLDIEPYVARLNCMAGTRNDGQDDIDEATVQIRGGRCQ